MPAFEARTDIELAAEDDVKYQAVVDAMDRAVVKGFRDIGFVDPSSLSVKFKE
jgi:biopolymer transport protein ExbD